MTLQTGNFKHAQFQNENIVIATTDYNTPLERPFIYMCVHNYIGLCNKFLLNSVNCSVLPLGGANHSTYFVLN